jgi:hypothetical protein
VYGKGYSTLQYRLHPHTLPSTVRTGILAARSGPCTASPQLDRATSRKIVAQTQSYKQPTTPLHVQRSGEACASCINVHFIYVVCWTSQNTVFKLQKIWIKKPLTTCLFQECDKNIVYTCHAFCLGIVVELEIAHNTNALSLVVAPTPSTTQQDIDDVRTLAQHYSRHQRIVSRYIQLSMLGRLYDIQTLKAFGRTLRISHLLTAFASHHLLQVSRSGHRLLDFIQTSADQYSCIWRLYASYNGRPLESQEHDASRRPSGENVTALTEPLWPSSVCRAAPVSASQSWTVS